MTKPELIQAVVLLNIGALVFGWLGSFIDGFILAQESRSHRAKWMRGWKAHVQKIKYPTIGDLTKYAKKHNPNPTHPDPPRWKTRPPKRWSLRKDKPPSPPKRKLLELPLFVLAGACIVIEFFVFVHAFKTMVHADVWPWLGIALLVAFVGFVVIVAEWTIPAYARSDYKYREPVPPIEEDPKALKLLQAKRAADRQNARR
jgi:hypothetical protein